MDIISIKQANKAENGLRDFFITSLNNFDFVSKEKMNESQKQECMKSLILAINNAPDSETSKKAIKNIRKLGTPSVADNAPYYSASGQTALDLRKQELDLLNSLSDVILSLVIHSSVESLTEIEKQELFNNTYHGIKTIDALSISLNKKNKLFAMFYDQYNSAANYKPELVDILRQAEIKYADELYNDLLAPFVPAVIKNIKDMGSNLVPVGY